MCFWGKCPILKEYKKKKPMSCFTDFEFEELNEFKETDVNLLVSSRLDDMADQIAILVKEGRVDDAHLLRAEGLELATAADTGYNFLFINDFSEA